MGSGGLPSRASGSAGILLSRPAALALQTHFASVTSRVGVPTIGIGSGPDCDGQVLVSYDMLGLFEGPVPPFVKQYANLAATVTAATQAYVNDVRAGAYPQAASTV